MDSERVEKAVQLFSGGASCSQAILASFGPGVGLEQGEAVRVGAGLGAGFGRMQYLCGAISGGAIILSLGYGSSDPFDIAAKEAAYAAVNEFIRDMERQLGSSQCREILGVSIATPEERQEARQQGLFSTVCVNCVRCAAQYLDNKLCGNI